MFKDASITKAIRLIKSFDCVTVTSLEFSNMSFGKFLDVENSCLA